MKVRPARFWKLVETPSSCFCCCARQTKAPLLSIHVRGQGGASHHLVTKAQVTQRPSAFPHFLPSPISLPHPTSGSAGKNRGIPTNCYHFFFWHTFSFNVHNLVTSSFYFCESISSLLCKLCSNPSPLVKYNRFQSRTAFVMTDPCIQFWSLLSKSAW